MQFTYLLVGLAPLVSFVTADLHNFAVCANNRDGGDFTLLKEATECACNYYKNRNTGNKQWDQCPDCTFNGMECHSAGWHIGGDEMYHYCTTYCHAEGSVGTKISR
ncbi:hypothetical protein BS50DRAFT_645036 [Corynespora cassiicola Philippines]|uniref:Uncharacterized protein n=1 Tax=Corynespora cassiicola Philippines TaxID=1448308 RepID=A0A2T2NHY4_CORCC|nr:hypothetical protein BS50DRAFT_645036 [Corynespora cassiicola Philippines]